MNHVLIVHWPDGKTEVVQIPPNGEVTIGTGEPATPVEFYDRHENVIGRLTVCGGERPTWMVCQRHPDRLARRSSWCLVPQPLWVVPEPWEERDEPTQPEHAKVSVLDLLLKDDTKLTENDCRRIHALADLLTALELLVDVVTRQMPAPECWSESGRMRQLVDRTRNHLQTMLSCAEFLTETTADFVDLTLAEAELHNPSTAFEIGHLDFMRKPGKA